MATKYTIIVKPSGGDYTSLSAAVNAISSDLTTDVVMSHSGIVGTLSDQATVTGLTSGAFGTLLHVTSTQIAIRSVSGTFQNGEQVYSTQNVNYVITTSGPDSIQLDIKIDGTWASADGKVSIGGYTTDSTHNINIYTSNASIHPGYFSNSSPYYRIVANVNGGAVLNVSVANVSITGIQVNNTNTVNSNSTGITLSATNFTGDQLISISNSNTSNGNSNSFREQVNNLIYTIKNGVFIAYHNDAIQCAGGTVNFYNCVFVSGSGFGFNKNLGSSTTAHVINCYATGISGGFNQGSGTLNVTTSASSDGSRSTTTVAYDTTTFTNVTSGNENFSLVNGSGLIWVGTNESLIFTDDIIGNTRYSSGVWDIGAFMYTASSSSSSSSSSSVSSFSSSSSSSSKSSSSSSSSSFSSSSSSKSSSSSISSSSSSSLSFSSSSSSSSSISSSSSSLSSSSSSISSSSMSSSSSSANTTVVTLQGVGVTDTYIDYNNPITNYGSNTSLMFSHPNNLNTSQERMLVRFDISSIPNWSTVTSAQLSLYWYSGNNGTTNSIHLGVRRVFKPWNVNQATWNNWDSTDSWGSYGCQNQLDNGVDNSQDMLGADCKNTPEDSITIPGLQNASGWLNWNIPTLTQKWVNGSAINNGVIFAGLTADQASGFIPLFYSTDYSGDTTLRPMLVITYYGNSSSSSSSSSSLSSSSSSKSSSSSSSKSFSSSSVSSSSSSSSSSSRSSSSYSISSSSKSLSSSSSSSSSKSSSSLSSSSSSLSSSSSSSSSVSSSSSSANTSGSLTYTRGDEFGLPWTDTNLEIPFSSSDYTTVSAQDSSLLQNPSTRGYSILLFKTINASGPIAFYATWYGQSTIDCSVSPVYLQLFNQTTGVWVTIAFNNTTPVNTGFTLTSFVSSGFSVYFDSNNNVSTRVYQLAA